MRAAIVSLILGVHYNVAHNTNMFVLKDIFFVIAWKKIYMECLHTETFCSLVTLYKGNLHARKYILCNVMIARL
jgi:hypothetical protein